MADVQVDSFRPDSCPVNDDMGVESPYFVESIVSPKDNLPNYDIRSEINDEGELSLESENEEVKYKFNVTLDSAILQTITK